MSKMIQIRNVPDDVHRKLKMRAAERGVSLSDYLLRIAEREAGRVNWDEMSRRVRARKPVASGTTAADLIREARGPIP